ncbi:uncharacterized protein LOC142342510 [Convolutriloba macropyga]|uniref:uncharacterized protein LOC142342510 n=1 Tax=Convolutriloba macropyga TaxID=536237 RepID=UPI003F521473
MTRRSTYNSQHTLSVKHPKRHTTMSKVNNFHSLLMHPFGFQRGALFWMSVLSLGLSIGGSSAGVMVHKGGSRSAGGVRSGSSSPTNVFLRMRYFEEDALHCVDCIDKRISEEGDTFTPRDKDFLPRMTLPTLPKIPKRDQDDGDDGSNSTKTRDAKRNFAISSAASDIIRHLDQYYRIKTPLSRIGPTLYPFLFM